MCLIHITGKQCDIHNVIIDLKFMSMSRDFPYFKNMITTIQKPLKRKPKVWNRPDKAGIFQSHDNRKTNHLQEITII